MESQKSHFKNSKYEVETAFTSQIKRLEFLNKKQLESFEASLTDKEDYISEISQKNENLCSQNTQLQIEIENIHRNLSKVMEERDGLKVDLRSIQMDTEREISHIRSDNLSRFEQMTADLRVKTETSENRTNERVDEVTRDLKN